MLPPLFQLPGEFRGQGELLLCRWWIYAVKNSENPGENSG